MRVERALVVRERRASGARVLYLQLEVAEENLPRVAPLSIDCVYVVISCYLLVVCLCVLCVSDDLLRC